MQRQPAAPHGGVYTSHTRSEASTPDAAAVPTAGRSGTAPVLPLPFPPRTLGMTFGEYHDRSIYQYHPEVIDRVLDDFVAMGLTDADIVPVWFMPDLYSTEIHPLGDSGGPGTHGITISDADLVTLITRCQAKGLRPVLRPFVELYDWVTWRAYIQPTDIDAWFASLRTMLLHYAAIAEAHQVPLFVIGTEYESMVGYTQQWRDSIAAVRQVYSGELTYAANWDRLNQVQFFDDLDYIAIDFYGPAATTFTPTVAGMRQTIHNNFVNLIQPTYERFQKPVLIMEFGIQNVDGAARTPYQDFTAYNPVQDDAEQADYYQAFLQAATDFAFIRRVAGWEYGIRQAASEQTISFKPAAAARQALTTYGREFLQAEPYAWQRLDQDTDYFEYQLFRGSQHILSAISDHGAFALRPHPGRDSNGWGSTWYPEPFLSGATLHGATLQVPVADRDGVTVSASGPVSRGTDLSWGTWQTIMRFTFDPVTRTINGTGSLTLSLPAALSDTTGDLSLFKLAGNYLIAVPLLQGGMGNTGDMASATATGDTFTYTWTPALDYASYFPQDTTDTLTITAAGAYNQVDTAAQGFAPIAAAYKPTLSVSLTSQQADIPMIFGGYYTSAKAQDFTADNVGLTPVLLHDATQTALQFSLAFAATPPANETIFDLTLQRGWNLVAFPFPEPFTIRTLFGQLKTGPLWRWDAAARVYVATPDSARPEAQVGYWVYCSESGQLPPLAGPYLARQTILQSGWNLIGPGAPGTAAPALPTGGFLWDWLESSQVYDGLGPAQAVLPGQAYWLYLNAPSGTVTW